VGTETLVHWSHTNPGDRTPTLLACGSCLCQAQTRSLSRAQAGLEASARPPLFLWEFRANTQRGARTPPASHPRRGCHRPSRSSALGGASAPTPHFKLADGSSSEQAPLPAPGPALTFRAMGILLKMFHRTIPTTTLSLR